jgi:hypothetical protein
MPNIISYIWLMLGVGSSYKSLYIEQICDLSVIPAVYRIDFLLSYICIYCAEFIVLYITWWNKYVVERLILLEIYSQKGLHNLWGWTGDCWRLPDFRGYMVSAYPCLWKPQYKTLLLLDLYHPLCSGVFRYYTSALFQSHIPQLIQVSGASLWIVLLILG